MQKPAGRGSPPAIRRGAAEAEGPQVADSLTQQLLGSVKDPTLRVRQRAREEDQGLHRPIPKHPPTYKHIYTPCIYGGRG